MRTPSTRWGHCACARRLKNLEKISLADDSTYVCERPKWNSADNAPSTMLPKTSVPNLALVGSGIFVPGLKTVSSVGHAVLPTHRDWKICKKKKLKEIFRISCITFSKRWKLLKVRSAVSQSVNRAVTRQISYPQNLLHHSQSAPVNC